LRFFYARRDLSSLLEWSDEGIKKQRQFLELPLRLHYFMLGFSKMKGRPTEGRSILFNIGKVHPFQYRKGPSFHVGKVHPFQQLFNSQIILLQQSAQLTLRML
jgi:hypothetical protein